MSCRERLDLWRRSILISCALIGLCNAQEQTTRSPSTGSISRDFIAQHCMSCHNREEKTGGLALDVINSVDITLHPDVWEKVVRKLRARQMPPMDVPRPDDDAYETVLSSLESALNKSAADNPNPGRPETFRRLTRFEYQNAIRDLLGLDIDVTTLLPVDESTHGFDNMAVGNLSPTLLDRYINAAQKISQLAVGNSRHAADTIRIRADITQEEHVEGLPLGTRGGTLVTYTFPKDGEYEIDLRLARDRNEEVEGLSEPHELEVLLDRRRVASFTVAPPPDGTNYQVVDAHLKTRIAATGGAHQLGVTFLKNPSSLLETKRQPYQAHFNMHRHPRISPALYQISINGPFDPTASGDTPSRQRIFVCKPADRTEEEACARRILAALMRKAYRRPIVESDLQRPMEFYRQGRAEGDFEDGIEMALSAILVNPQFLFRIEQDPPGVAPRTTYRITDLQLASRLSFFLWSSLPDDELLDLAVRNELGKKEVFEQQVRRMLRDKRSESLVTNFAGQWLHLRNLESITPDLRLFPDFDDNLRQAFRKETELLFKSVLNDDRSVLDLLKSDHTYLNERLAKHYGIPHVYGSRFRRVSVADNGERGGLLRHGSVLTVTSYATRTSPVIRGKWILENLLGTPPPPPPANVPALKDNTVSALLSVRERLAEHRANDACASCHRLMDPVGFALENFDAVGRHRMTEEGKSIDSTGGLPDGRQFAGVSGLEQALLDRPELFVTTVVENLLAYATGRNVEHFDGPAVRNIVRQASSQQYRLSSLVLGITTSTPFQMRRSE